jgi:glycosyltransferase involved in cell wall biosynthesis
MFDLQLSHEEMQAPARMTARPQPAAAPNHRFRILTTVQLTNRLPGLVDVDWFEIGGDSRIAHAALLARLIVRSRSYDALLAFNPGIELTVVAFLVRLLSAHRTLVVFFDALLPQPASWKKRAIARVKRILFWGVDKFFCVHKDTSGYERHYGISPDKCYYVPFKANNIRLRSEFNPIDGDYVLSCGASYRDFATLIEAVAGLGYPTRIVLPSSQVARYHHTQLDEAHLPAHVRVIRHDFDPMSWNSQIANARLVVIPILKRALQPAGISVYLEAMALGKPVIVSEGPSTNGLLTYKEAVIVPAEDPEALASAMQDLWENKSHRERIAKGGQEYALSLGGEDRLVSDLLQGIHGFLQERRRRSRSA